MITTNKSGTLKQLTQSVDVKGIKGIDLIGPYYHGNTDYHVVNLEYPLSDYEMFMFFGYIKKANTSTSGTTSVNMFTKAAWNPDTYTKAETIDLTRYNDGTNTSFPVYTASASFTGRNNVSLYAHFPRDPSYTKFYMRISGYPESTDTAHIFGIRLENIA